MADGVGPMVRKHFSVPAWLLFTVALLLFLGILTTSLSLYQIGTNGKHGRQALHNELRSELCGIVRASIAPGGPAPSTARGVAVASAMRDLYRQLGC